MTHQLAIESLTKVFQNAEGPVTAVDNVSFAIGGDDFFTMLGPSGCGKTTTLRMIAGLESITSGRVVFDGRDFTRFSAFQRGIGMVFQSYALFPHMTVFENAAYGLRVRQLGEDEVRARVERTLDKLGLGGLAQRHPSDLSGGQQQRVSIARALVYEPTMLLLDEPLANLDAKLRVQMREEIRRIQKDLGIMTIYVTHDQEEAMSVSDRIGVFDRGRLCQFGAPADVYADPSSLFVADFIGKANFLKVRIESASAQGAKVSGAGLAPFGVGRVAKLDAEESAEVPAGSDGLIQIRPEHLEIGPAESDGLPCRVLRIQVLGSFVRYIVACEGATRDVTVDRRRLAPGLAEGAAARLSFSAEDVVLFAREGRA
ncbi:MAG: ABC transporter ATP-binding protein [Alphaproteobacteria bacterium]|nr:ABC transporter ATP-binding protein [Alphaproteobacteria bacterium]